MSWRNNLADILLNNNTNEFANLGNENVNVETLLAIKNAGLINNNSFKQYVISYSGNGPNQLADAFLYPSNIITANMRNAMVRNIKPYSRNKLLTTTLNDIRKKNRIVGEDIRRLSTLLNKNIAKSPKIQRLIQNEIQRNINSNSINRKAMVNLLRPYVIVHVNAIRALEGLPQNVRRRIVGK